MSNLYFLSRWRRWLAAGLLTLTPLLAAAGPGAHGPNGEHLDAPTTAGNGQASPRTEAQSDLFELVGTLAGGELSILIDRFATNEPVLNAEVEVESGGLKAKAKFHADGGDYSIDDAAFLKAVSAPGEHALVITVLAGKDTDLLDGVLRVGALVGEHDASAGWSFWVGKLGVALLALSVLVWVAWLWRRRAARSVHFTAGGRA